MSILNIVGLIFLFACVLIGTVIKLYTRKKLRELDGLGEISTESKDGKNTIRI